MALLRSRTLRLLAVAVVTAAAAGCGGDAEDTPSPDEVTAAIASAEQQAGQAETRQAEDSGGGNVTFTLEGKTSELASDPCYILTMVDRVLSVRAQGLSFTLPPEPGDFADGDHGVAVTFPDPGTGVIYSNTNQAHGSWSRDGDHASGHLEGTTSKIPGTDDADFTIDFECGYQELS